LFSCGGSLLLLNSSSLTIQGRGERCVVQVHSGGIVAEGNDEDKRFAEQCCRATSGFGFNFGYDGLDCLHA
jgi:hypothetical protein